MRYRFVIGVITAAALITSIRVYAHHSFAATYFEDKQQTIEGDIVQFLLRNPHSRSPLAHDPVKTVARQLLLGLPARRNL